MREIDPKIFGPGTWTVSHVLGLVCDESGKDSDFKFYALLIYRTFHALPCGNCRKHSVRYLDKNPVPSSRREGSLFEWSVRYHNVVNARLGKPKMSLEDARVHYSNTEVVMTNPDKTVTCSLSFPVKGESTAGCEDGSLWKPKSKSSGLLSS